VQGIRSISGSAELCGSFLTPCKIKKMEQIKSTGFIVEYQGDETVGMFSQQWHISGDFMFESEEDFSAFKFKISQAFEFCSDTPISVESLEERSRRINKELTAFPGAFHSV